MAEACDPQAAVAPIERGIHHGREDVRPGHGVVVDEAAQHLRRCGVLDRVGPHRCPQPAHDRRRVDALAADVADGDPDLPAMRLDDVVPIAADRERLGRRAVAHGDLVFREGRKKRRQQAALERLRGAAHLDVEPRPLERLRGGVGERPSDIASRPA